MRTAPVLVFLALSTIALSSGAQPAQPRPPAPTPQGPPGAPAPGEVTAPTAPPALEIADPLLAPVPPAPRTLHGWREALDLIGTSSSDLVVARLEVDRARGASRAAFGRALPTVTATGSIVHHFIRGERPALQADGTIENETVPPTPTALAQLTVSQPILAPRVWYGIGTADRAIDAARLSADDRYRTQIAAVANQIVTVVTAERVAEINRVGLRSALERLELFQRRLNLGSGTALDIVRAQQDVNLARATLLTGDESLKQAREALGLALGSGDAYGVTTTISLDDIERSARASCTPATADTRSDVLAAKVALEIAERGVTDAKLAYAPSAEVETTATLSSETLANTKQYSWSIQGLITIPIWDGGSRYGTMRSARAGAAQQKERVLATQRAASLEANQSLRGIAVAEQARALAEQARDLARETARLSQRAFDAGAATSFELVDAARRQREAELDLAVREFELVKAKIAALLASASCK